MDWQWLVVISIVAMAAGYLARRAWRTWSKRGCGGCGSSPNSRPSPATLIPPEDVRLRR